MTRKVEQQWDGLRPNPNGRETRTENLRIAYLKRADWNTHKHSRKWDDEVFKGLVESIRANGMIQRVVVRVMPDAARTGAAQYEIIDGHRRADAALALGWKEVPCEVHAAMDDDEARAMTLTANVQRLENDPLLEASCIRLMADAGKTYEQIAAVLGKDARYVARRARLCDLSDKWREWFGKVDADADTMEMVAAHEKELQDEVYEALEMDEDGEVDFDMLERAFKRRLRKLDENTGFDIEDAGCATCPFNTANHGLLFPAEEGDCAGRCEKSECFVRHWNENTDSLIEALRKKKVEVKAVAQKWNIPNSWNATPRKTKRNTQPYVYTEDGLKYLVFAEPDGGRGATRPTEALTEEEKAEQKRVKKAHSEWARNRKAAIEKIRDAVKGEDDRKRIVDAVVESDTFFQTMADRFRDGIEHWASDGDCLLVWRCVGDDFLNGIGSEMTAEEINALENDDPANLADDGEEQDA